MLRGEINRLRKEVDKLTPTVTTIDCTKQETQLFINGKPYGVVKLITADNMTGQAKLNIETM